MARQRISGQQAYSNFSESFRRVYDKATPLRKSAMATDSLTAETAAALGHPEYINLQAGESLLANAVVSFVDIRGVTRLSFALDATELFRVIQALTEASIQAIHDGGGYIGEFTGDGVMAYFGNSSQSDEEATLAALETTSLLFKSVEEIVNPRLKQQGLDPIRISAGMEFGEVLWSRIGVGEVSQLKPIGTATFLAGKLSQGAFTKSWECKVGGDLAKWIPEEFRERTTQYGPVMVNGEQFSRELYLFNWRQFAADTMANQIALEDRMRKSFSSSGSLAALASTARIVQPPTPGTNGPRPLKDQPFF
jgi:class 3 adenylate cyclase